MTTVIGLADEEAKIAILCADRQGTHTDSRSIPIYKNLNRKLWISDDSRFAFGHAGYKDPDCLAFVEKLVEGKLDIEKAVKECMFPELRELNLKRLGYKLPDSNNFSAFLLATRFGDKPALYTCWPLGAVEPRRLTYIGSGSKRVEEYFDAIEVLNRARDYAVLTEKTGRREGIIHVGLESLRLAQGIDPYSSGLDLVVVTPEGIKDHFKELQDDFGERLSKIKEQYK